MLPISDKQLEELGEVTFEQEGEMEQLARETFESCLQTHQDRNKKILQRQMKSKTSKRRIT